MDDVSLFIRDGRPANLGSDGSKPFGVQPPFYFPGDSSAPGVNLGSAGNFTSSVGTFTDVSESIKV